MKITVVGMGYVGLANAILLSQKHEVSILEISRQKVDLFNNGIAPIQDSLVSKYLSEKKLKISATTNVFDAYDKAKYIVVCAPTNYSVRSKSFDTSILDKIIDDINESNFKGLIVIRSTIPIGFSRKIQQQYQDLQIAFFPEFLREGSALEDCLYPSRIVCGSRTKSAKNFAKILVDCCDAENIKILFTDSGEAESIKLFSNAYLAMRVSFFNELDSFALAKSLSTEEIIMGLSMDSRIGNFYNNPSFGFGGYCLPKDTKQLLSDFHSVPQQMISGTINSNIKRKHFIANELIKNKAKRIGIYRLSMKAESDNARDAAILDIIKILKKENKTVIIYEPSIKTNKFNGLEILNNFKEFISKVDLIVANRMTDELKNLKIKIFTRDIFKSN